ncbi:GAF domain-containing protein [Kribbella sp. NPDC004875]|uniref:GAF domain-containing protein n=1 Tax=Kribbella sp. NPDC004875 TaxID=3364107 RepID=UPI0036916687
MGAGLSAWIRPVRERADLELARASRAGAIARRHERLMMSAPDSARPLHERMARLHRKNEERHLTAARLHDAHIRRLRRWFDLEAAAASRRPLLISTVAEMLGARSAGITLLSSRSAAAASMTASDPLAAAAQELEFTLGEGPVHDSAASGRLVVVAEDSLADRWRLYSPAVAALGVRSVAAAPLGLPDNCLGALAVFDPPPDRPAGPTVEEIADALTHTILLTDEYVAQLIEEGSVGDKPAGSLVDGPGDTAVIHQAAGMVAAQCGCSVGDALALVTARAFADNELVTSTARRIVQRRLRLDTP